jgi:DNA polymerase I
MYHSPPVFPFSTQGSAADIIKAAMVRCSALRSKGKGPALVAQLHDELLFEVEEESIEAATQAVQVAMEGAATLAVPLTVKLRAGRRWGDMTEVRGGGG